MRKILSLLVCSLYSLSLLLVPSVTFAQEETPPSETSTEETTTQQTDAQVPSEEPETPPETSSLVDPPPDDEEEVEVKETPSPAIDFSKFLKGLKGKSDVDLFSGSATFRYPLWVPEGRLGMTPDISLRYNSNNRQFDSLVGYGWSLPTNAIFRSTAHGVNELYDRNDFSVDIEGNTEELISTDAENGQYGARYESDFTTFEFLNNSWKATDTRGMIYTFGTSASNRLDDPNDSSRVYKWMLEKIEDRNGNTVTFTYHKQDGQIYPDTIRYTNFGETQGIYEIRFIRGNRFAYTNYTRAFKTVTNRLIDKIELYSYDSGTAQLIYYYDLDYTERNAAVVHLDSVTIKKGANNLPPTEFDYYDGTENIEGKRIDYLSTVQYPYGAEQHFFYKPSTAYRINGELQNKTPFIIHTVHKSTSQANTSSPVYTTQYDYQDGHYFYEPADAFKKEYAGFHIVTVTDPADNIRKLYFHQDQYSADGTDNGEFEDHIAKKGRQYRSEQYDDAGNLYDVTITKWDKTSLSDDDEDKDRFFLFQKRQTSITYDGDTTKRAKATEWEYDTYGNITKETSYGEVTLDNEKGDFTDILTDKREQTITYATNSDEYLYAYPQTETLKDNANTIIGETKTYYDDLPLGSVEKGLVTKQEQLVTSPDISLTTKTEYNTYGLPTKTINARNYATTTTYDTHKLYPITIINPKNQTTNFTYDYFWGEPTETTDPNGAKSVTVFDDFGRIKEQKVTDPANTSQELKTTEYTYELTTEPIGILEKTFPHHDNIEVLKKTYLDGFGRTIQVRTEAEGTDQFTVLDTIYDERGNVAKETLPVFATGISFSAPATDAKGNEYTYDPLNRRTTITNDIGTTTITYDDWKQTTTDPEGNDRDLTTDAFGNLITVTEHLDGETYDTIYEYNALNQMTKLTDALGNYKTFAYDLLGRRLTETMLHTPNDTTFGTWNFSYDANGNMTSRTDPKNQIVNWTYDELDRPLTEDFIGEVGTEITYLYDQGTNGIGRLTAVTSQGATDTYTYDIVGRLVQEERGIDGQTFVTIYTYDLLGRPLTIVYPRDNVIVSYLYNQAGQLNQVKKGDDFILTNLDYTPTGSVGKIEYANGITTTNTYDIEKLYRLTFKNTTDGTTDFQDIEYAYDKVGNLQIILNNNDNDTKKSVIYIYDDLYRLKRVNMSGTADGQHVLRDYRYDIIGNMTRHEDWADDYAYAGNNDTTSSSTVATPHAVTSIGSKNFTYDENGNMVSDGTWTHTWDYRNQLSSSTNGTKTITYTYDHQGQRTRKEDTDENKKTYYVNKIFDQEGGENKLYFRAGDMKVATQSESSCQAPQGIPITTCQELQNIDTDLGGTYYLANDIDCSDTINWNNGQGFDPLGDDNTAVFTGRLDGQGHEIKDLYINRDTITMIGLIAQTGNNAEVKNIGITNINLVSNGKAGGIAGQMKTGSVLDNVWTSGNIIGTNAGGIVGRLYDGTITNSYSHANINASNAGGGIGGKLRYQSGTQILENVYSTGAITGTNQVGGLVGDADMGTASATNSYWDMQTSGQSTSPLGVGKSTVEMKMKNTFQSWDFVDTWEMEENVSYPMLQVENSGGGSCTGEPTLVYHHEDHLTGSNVDTDESGALNQVLDYYAFGATRIDEQYGNFTNDYKFTGKEKDTETGLYYYGARYYNSELGRFISRDTWEGELENPQSLNRYSYTVNNPLKYTDPTGNFFQYFQLAWELIAPNTTYAPSPQSVANIPNNTISPAQTALNILSDRIPGGKGGTGTLNFARKNAQKAKSIWSSTRDRTSVQNAFNHYKDHKGDFSDVQNAKQYVEKANNFLSKPPKGSQQYTRQTGNKNTIIYDKSSNTLGVKTPNGTPASIFKPKEKAGNFISNVIGDIKKRISRSSKKQNE